MKNKKFIIIATVIVLIVLIIILVVISNNKKQSNNIIANNTTNTATNSTTVYEDDEVERDENLAYQTNSNSNINNNNNISNSNSTSDNTVIAIPANNMFKQILVNDTWLNSHIYLKTDCFGNEINKSTKQDLKFIKIEKEDYSAPIVILKVECSEALSSKCYAITYDSGEINVTSIGEEAPSHSGHTEYQVDSSNGVVYKMTQYSDLEQYDIYSISANGVNKVCTIRKENQIVDSSINYTYYYNDNECTESEYKNIRDKYIRDNIRKDTYKTLNSDNVEANF